jgi:DNA-binding transcriptional regulator GbsR (MarR family)
VNLPPLVQTFVLHFGEMGSRWGINRTVGQIYALLFISSEPLNAEDIVERLGVSRSNVSMGLKELQAWNLVRLQHKPGDRRDYFSTPDDIWQIVRTLVEERKNARSTPRSPSARGADAEPAAPRSVTPRTACARCTISSSCSPAGTTTCSGSKPSASFSS